MANSSSAPATATRNPVPEMIRHMKISKAAGRFTYHAGRADAAINLVIAGVCLITLAGVGQGAYNLANGKGRLDM